MPDSGWPAALKLSDEALFAPSFDPGLTAQLLDSRFVGVALRAPARIDIGQRSSLPLLVASRFDGARGWAWPLQEQGWLVAVELRSGQVLVKSAFGSDKRAAPAGRGDKPSPDDLRQYGAQLTPIDARSRLGVPWQPGCWSIRLVYHDWLSNPVLVHLDQPSSGPTQAGSGAGCRAPAGVQARFGRVASAAGADRVAGRFRLPVQALGDDRSAVPASLLLVAPDGAVPERIDWRIPVVVVAGAQSITGSIEQALPTDRPLAGAALAYLVLGGQVHGPQPWRAPAKPPRR